MLVKRNKLNEYILREFLENDREYKSSFNGMEVFRLRLNTMYGKHTMYLPCDIGETIKIIKEDNIEEMAMLIFETLCNIEKIYEQKRSFNEYCSNNKWTRSGT